MATITDPRYNSALPVAARRIVEIMAMGDDDLREAFLVTCILLGADTVVEGGYCELFDADAHDEFHAQLDILAEYNAVRVFKWHGDWLAAVRS